VSKRDTGERGFFLHELFRRFPVALLTGSAPPLPS
jgi:hypothetical protein